MQLLLQQNIIKYSTFQKCVFVSLGIQHAMCMLQTVICDLSGYNIFLHIISLMDRFLKKLLKIKFVF